LPAGLRLLYNGTQLHTSAQTETHHKKIVVQYSASYYLSCQKLPKQHT
jgi:hypothetical protein